MKTTLIKEQDAMLAIIKGLPGNYLIVLPNAPTYTIVEVSEEYNNATFTKREEIIGLGIFDVFPDDPNDDGADGVAKLSASFQTVITNKQSHEMPVQRYPIAVAEETFIEKYWIAVNKPVIVNGTVAYIIHFVTDVTDSKQLKSREQYFRALADESPFMIWRSAGPSCIYVNDSWVNTTGLSLENSLGSGYLKAFYPEDLQEQKTLFSDALKSHSSYETKFRIVDKNGGIRWVFMKATPNTLNAPTIEYIGSLIDITEHENATQRIIESEKQFRQMADSIIQMIWVTDEYGMHEYYNQRWYDFTGMTYEDTQGEGWNQVFHPDDQERAWEIWRHSLQTGAPYEIEYRLRKYTGEFLWVLGRAAPFRDSDGKIVKWFGTCTDINEQKLLQQQKDEFINVASHELKTPLTSLTANVQFIEKLFLKRQDIDPMLFKLISSSQNSVKKLNTLIDDLLHANSIGLGQLSIKKEWFDLVPLAIESTLYLSGEQQEIRLTGLPLLKVYADQGKIEQVIVNLVNNARKYAKESKSIEIDFAETNEYVKVSVTDHGQGIAKEKIKFLFDRYYQAKDNSGMYSGMGLGLYICANIINGHEGKIGVESELGKGSTFWFTLPKN